MGRFPVAFWGLSFALPTVTVPQNALVFPGADGRLIYRPANARGDVIPDFSNCGYGGGGVDLPAAPFRTAAP